MWEWEVWNLEIWEGIEGVSIPPVFLDIANIYDLEYELSQVYTRNNIIWIDMSEVIDTIIQNIWRNNIPHIKHIFIKSGYCVIQYEQNWIQREFVYSLLNRNETFTSLSEIRNSREREAQKIVTRFEHHLDAMRQIFRANHESSQRWGEFIMDRWALNEQDIFTEEMADEESQTLIWKTLLQIQEQARIEYMQLLEFLGEYPESALSPSLQEMIQTQINTYTRMIMWVGIEYNGGAWLFRQKTEEEIRFWITYGVSRCQTPEEVFAYFRSWHQDMRENWWDANALTQRQSYPIVSNILSHAIYVRIQELTRWNPGSDTAQIFSEFIYYLRGWEAMNGRGVSWSVDINFEVQSELTDTVFANQIIHDYFTTYQVLEKLERENSIGFEISDPLIWEKNCSEIMLQAWTILQRTWIDNDDIIRVINQVLWWIDSTQLNGKTYRELGIEDKFRITCLARFIQDTEHLIFQINRHEEFWFYFAEYHNTGWRPPELTKEYLLERYRWVIIPWSIQYFWSIIGENFNGRNRMNPQDIEVLTPWERNLLGIWSDMNGYGGFFDVSDSTLWYIGTGTELAAMIAITAGLTFATWWIATVAWWVLGVARLTQVWNTVRNSAMIQGAVMWWYSVPISRYMHPEWHDNWNERFIDLGSDYTVWILTWLLGWALAQRYWRAWAHGRNLIRESIDIWILGFWTEAIRNQIIYNHLHGQEEFLWDGIELEGWWNNQLYFSIDGVTTNPQSWEPYSSFPISP